MGSGISLNYDNIQTLFTVGYWDIKRAVQKSTKQHVCLWVFDYPKIKAKERNTNDRHNYMENVIASIKAQQKVRHPNILKIFEVSEDMKSLAFSSEPIEFQSANDPCFTRDEAIFASKQLASAMQFLNEDCHTAYLTLSPEAIFFDKQFNLKLCLFTFAKPYKEISQPIQMRAPWTNNTMHIPARYAAPEVIHNQTITVRADSFMYGLIVYYFFTNKHALSATSLETHKPSELQSKFDDIPEEYADLIKLCFNDVASLRPNFIAINNDEAFSSTVCDAFQYLQQIDTKDPKDVYSFLSGLADIVHVFSTRIKQYMFLPIFLRLAQTDARYGIIIIPIVLTISEALEKSEILPMILEPLRPLFEKPSNPMLCKSILNNIDFISSNISPSQYPAFIFPAIFFALGSNSSDLIQLGITKLPIIIENLSSQVLADQILPKIATIIPQCKDAQIATLNINIIEKFVTKLENDIIAVTICPKILELYRKQQWDSIPLDYYKILSQMSLKQDTIMKFIVPMCTEFLQNRGLPANLQGIYFNYMLKSIMIVMKERNISSNVEVPDTFIQQTNEATSPENKDPFGVRLKKVQQQQQQQPPKPQNPPEEEPKNNDPFGTTQSQSQKTNSGFGNDPFGSQSQSSQPQPSKTADSGFGSDPFGTSQPQQAKTTSGFGNDPFGSQQQPAKPQQPPANSGFGNDLFGTTQPTKPQPQSSSGFGNDPFGTTQPKKQENSGFNFTTSENKPAPSNNDGFNFADDDETPQNNNDFFGNQNNQKSNSGIDDPFGNKPQPAKQPTATFSTDAFASSQPQKKPQQNSGFGNDPFGTTPPQKPQDNGFGNDPFGSQQQKPQQSSGFGNDPFGQQPKPQQQPQNTGFGNDAFSQPQKPQQNSGFGDDPFGQPQKPQQPSNSGFGNDPFGSQPQKPQQNSGFGNDPFGQPQKQSQPQNNGFGDDMFGSQLQKPQQNTGFGNDPFGQQPKPQQQPQNSGFGNDAFSQPQKPQQSSRFGDDPFGQPKPQQQPSNSGFGNDSFSKPQPKPSNGGFDTDVFGARPQPPRSNDPFGTTQPQQSSGFGNDAFGSSQQSQNSGFGNDPFGQPQKQPQHRPSFGGDVFATQQPQQMNRNASTDIFASSNSGFGNQSQNNGFGSQNNMFGNQQQQQNQNNFSGFEFE